VYRAIDKHGRVFDVLVSARRHLHAARRVHWSTPNVTPTQAVTDKAPVYRRVLEELAQAAWHHVEQYANNRIDGDDSRLKWESGG
jgi:transposase, IS6 family